jgi:hypothetical protein
VHVERYGRALEYQTQEVEATLVGMETAPYWHIHNTPWEFICSFPNSISRTSRSAGNSIIATPMYRTGAVRVGLLLPEEQRKPWNDYCGILPGSAKDRGSGVHGHPREILIAGHPGDVAEQLYLETNLCRTSFGLL